MVWLIILYALVSVAVTVSAAVNAGIGPGLYAFLTSSLVLAAAAALKGSLLSSGAAAQKIAAFVFPAILLAVAYWLSSGFSAQLFGFNLSGTAWGIIGFVICFLCADRRLYAAP